MTAIVAAWREIGRLHDTYMYAYLKQGAELVYSTSVVNYDSPLKQVAEMELSATRNKKAQKTVGHVIVAFAPGEQPSPSQLSEVAGDVLGLYGAHHGAAFLHTDGATFHIHIVFHLVRVDGSLGKTYRDRYKLRQLCREYEDKWGLKKTRIKADSIPVIGKAEIEASARRYREGDASDPLPPRLKLRAEVCALYERADSFTSFESSARDAGLEMRAKVKAGKLCSLSFGNGEIAVTLRESGHPVESLKFTPTPEELDRLSAMPPKPFNESNEHGKIHRIKDGGRAAGMDAPAGEGSRRSSRGGHQSTARTVEGNSDASGASRGDEHPDRRNFGAQIADALSRAVTHMHRSRRNVIVDAFDLDAEHPHHAQPPLDL
jgi:hypothetical protein